MLDVAIRGAFINCGAHATPVIALVALRLGLTVSRLRSTGQNCVSAERFYIHSKIYDRFVKDIAAKMKTLRQVNAATLHACCNLKLSPCGCQGPSVLPDERKSTDVVAKCCDFGAITMRGQVGILPRVPCLARLADRSVA